MDYIDCRYYMYIDGWMDYCQTRERERIKGDIKKERIDTRLLLLLEREMDCYYYRERIKKRYLQDY